MKRPFASVLLALCVATYQLHSQTGSSRQLADALAALPAQLTSNSFNMLEFTDMLESQVSSADANIAVALPYLKQDLHNPNIEVRRYALLTTSQLARRTDSSSELSSVLGDIYPYLDDTDEHLRLGAVITLQGLTPQAPDQAVDALLQALNKPTANSDFGVALVGSIARMKPADSNVTSKIIAFLERPDLDSNHKANAIEEIANPGLGDRLTQEVTDLVTASQDARVRDAAIAACAKIGPRAVRQVQSKLVSIRDSTTESLESRRRADHALSIVASQPK